MSAGEAEHQVVVNAWLRRTAKGHSVDSLLQAFEDACAALWQRSQTTLGDVTLAAIAERVLHVAAEQFPMLASLKIEASGVSCKELRSHSNRGCEELSDAIRFVLVEFLTVLGDLTADVLTPALHAELSRRPTANDSRANDAEPTA